MLKHLLFLFFIVISIQGFSQNQQLNFKFLTQYKWDSVKMAQTHKFIESYYMKLSDFQKAKVFELFFANSDIPYDEVIKLATYFKMNLNAKQKTELEIRATKASDNEINLRTSINEINSNLTGPDKEDLYRFYFLDFNNDQKVDLILMPDIYFGPSSGFRAFGRQDDMFVKLVDFSGEFLSFEKNNDEIFLMFSGSIIDPSEPNVLFTLKFNFLTKKMFLDSKIYLHELTEIPKILNNTKPFSTNDSLNLHFSAKSKLDSLPEYTTKVLFENVVAKYSKNSKGFLLAEKNGWGFVVFENNTNILKTSLFHGMEEGIPEENPLYQKMKIKPYLCGWIEKKFIVKD